MWCGTQSTGRVHVKLKQEIKSTILSPPTYAVVQCSSIKYTTLCIPFEARKTGNVRMPTGGRPSQQVTHDIFPGTGVTSERTFGLSSMARERVSQCIKCNRCALDRLHACLPPPWLRGSWLSLKLGGMPFCICVRVWGAAFSGVSGGKIHTKVRVYYSEWNRGRERVCVCKDGLMLWRTLRCTISMWSLLVHASGWWNANMKQEVETRDLQWKNVLDTFCSMENVISLNNNS